MVVGEKESRRRRLDPASDRTPTCARTSTRCTSLGLSIGEFEQRTTPHGEIKQTGISKWLVEMHQYDDDAVLSVGDSAYCSYLPAVGWTARNKKTSVGVGVVTDIVDDFSRTAHGQGARQNRRPSTRTRWRRELAEKGYGPFQARLFPNHRCLIVGTIRAPVHIFEPVELSPLIVLIKRSCTP